MGKSPSRVVPPWDGGGRLPMAWPGQLEQVAPPVEVLLLVVMVGRVVEALEQELEPGTMCSASTTRCCAVGPLALAMLRCAAGDLQNPGGPHAQPWATRDARG